MWITIRSYPDALSSLIIVYMYLKNLLIFPKQTFVQPSPHRYQSGSSRFWLVRG